MNFPDLIFPFDYIVLFIIIIIILFSFWKGFIQSILGLLTWVGSILICIYSYPYFSDILTKNFLNINFFQKNEYLTNIVSIIITIPVIFLISLFILKRFRKFLSSDLDKQILGIIFDKIFGFIYGIIFSYVILTTFIIIIERYKFKGFNSWLENNSNIIFNISKFNNEYIYMFKSIDNIKD